MTSQPQASVVFTGRLFNIEQVRFASSRASTLTREFVRHPGAVLIIPLLADGRMVLIRNFRHAVGRPLWEFPAGTLGKGEDPAIAAHRELLEETGYVAAAIHKLGEFYTSPGLGDELMRVFLAQDLSFRGQQLEDGEDIQTHTVTRPQIDALLRQGDLVDGKSIAGLYLFDAFCRSSHKG